MPVPHLLFLQKKNQFTSTILSMSASLFHAQKNKINSPVLLQSFQLFDFGRIVSMIYSEQFTHKCCNLHKLRVLRCCLPVPTNITSYVFPPGVLICGSTAICVNRYLEMRNVRNIFVRMFFFCKCFAETNDLLKYEIYLHCARSNQNRLTKESRNIFIHQWMCFDEI